MEKAFSKKEILSKSRSMTIWTNNGAYSGKYFEGEVSKEMFPDKVYIYSLIKSTESDDYPHYEFSGICKGKVTDNFGGCFVTEREIKELSVGKYRLFDEFLPCAWQYSIDTIL